MAARLTAVWVALVIVILFLAGLFCLNISDRHRDRIVRVFDLAKEYRVTLRETNVQFSTRWNDYLTDSVDPYNGGNLDEQAYDDLVSRFLDADGNRDSYAALAGFYESVGECVQVHLCDFWFARTAFGGDIVTFYHNMYPALQADAQQGHPTPGILDFVDRMRDADRGQLHPDWRDGLVAWAD